MRATRSLAPLRHGSFRLLAGGQMTSNVGDAFYSVALPWYVLATHGGPILLGTVLAAYGVPRTALVAAGGHASDRWRPWTVMMVADAVRAVAVGALAVLAGIGPAHAAELLPVAAVLGAGEGLFVPGSFAVVPSLLPDEDLQAGNALTYGGTHLATLVGPAVGGAVVAAVGPASAFGFDAVTFVVSGLTLLRVRTHQRRAARRAAQIEAGAVESTVRIEATDAVTGDRGRESDVGHIETRPETLTLWRVLASERVLQIILVVTVAANLGWGGMTEVALPALARGPFDSGAGAYGALVAAMGGGALVGTLAAGQLRRTRRPAMLASWAFFVDAVVISLVPYLGGAVQAGGALVVMGALSGFGNIVLITAFQRWAPAALLGRLMGLLMLSSIGVFPLSVLMGGVVVRALGPAAFFPLAAGVLALAVLGGLTQSSWRRFGSPPADDSTEARHSRRKARAKGALADDADLLEAAGGGVGTMATGAMRPAP